MASRRTSWLLASAMLYSICAEVRAAESVDFAHQVKPLLAQQCFACHGPLKQESNLRLDAGTLILAGG
ncbi:MAG: hypothetical protein KDA80_07775, partial [Planctomycetaceae bacterium]|nr:hypothetical protein [Planctomycetaceae bacterium]